MPHTRASCNDRLPAPLADSVPNKVPALATAVLDQALATFSTFDAGSELSQLNTSPVGTPVSLSDTLFEVIQVAFELHRMTKGVKARASR